MQGARARPAAAVLPFGVLVHVLLSGAGGVPSVLVIALAAGVLGSGLLGSALVGALVHRLLQVVRPVPSAGLTLHEHLRTLARRGVPRLRDPDAAGRTRSRAPSGLLPAV